MKDIQTGIVGYGFSGAIFHAPIISRVKGIKLAKVCSSDNTKVHRDFPEVVVVKESEELINDPDLDLIVVSSPNSTHFPLAEQALRAGKHVIVEKPFVNHSIDGEQLVRLAKENSRILSVFHNRRWDGDFLTVQKLINNGTLGDIHTFESHYDRYVPKVSMDWREVDQSGSGTLYDLGSHLIDQALKLFGMPKSIYADLDKQRDQASATDYFHLLLDYEKVKVILHSGMLMNMEGPRFQIHGTNGSYIKYGIDPQEEMLLQGKRPGDFGWGKENPECFGTFTQVYGGLKVKGNIETIAGCYEMYYQGMADAIWNGAPAPVSAEDALKTIKLIEAATLSSETGKEISI